MPLQYSLWSNDRIPAVVQPRYWLILYHDNNMDNWIVCQPQPTSPWLTSTSLSFLLSHAIKMVQNWLLLGCHLLLGVWILYRSLDVEQSFTTARNVAITTIVTIFSVVNFWIWICPMNRIRNVRARDRYVRLFKSLIISDSRCWIPSCWRNWEAEGRCSQQSQETQTDREDSATISKWMVSKCVWINFYDV